MKTRSRLGFSLIELSVVILVIGILIIGITQGSRIMKEAKLKSAKSLTSSSPVASSAGLVLWLETTSEKSFDSNLGDGGQISTWYDTNPQSTTKNDATQATSARQPILDTTTFNLPVVEFRDGGDDVGDNSLSLPPAVWSAKKGTIFIVSAMRSGVTTNTNTLFHFSDGLEDGYGGSNPVYEFHAHYFPPTYGTFAVDAVTGSADNFTIASSTFGTGNIYTPSILTITANPGNKFEFFVNGTSEKTSTITTQGNPDNQINYATIGAMVNFSSSRRMSGYIGEMIIFNRVLSGIEVAAINDYLSKKWGIKI
jgi:prepilin-type N-terminal cleavage/methylation domain-containing protein